MSVRVQVILDKEEAARFKSQAAKESKSLSAWLRDAGRRMLRRSRRPLMDAESLKAFFAECRKREKGTEPDWRRHKEKILEGFRVEGKL